ncbi:DNA cytosine methyltransferase [bacterium]|nr:DNA cytosine methyltransferase [bacterium]
MARKRFDYYEFFAGGGMARLGLEPRWRCLFANDNSPKKARAYAENFNGNHLLCKDVAEVAPNDLPGRAAMAWGSFPCQDLSLAGQRGGLRSKRSGAFWPFWELMLQLIGDKRPTPIIVLENVAGALTSHGGNDFQSLLQVLTEADYQVGPLLVDGVHFTPKSRPRLFLIAVRKEIKIPKKLLTNAPADLWRPASIHNAYQRADASIQNRWLWWSLPAPPLRANTLMDCLEENPPDVPWHTKDETLILLNKMSPVNRAKVKQAQAAGKRVVGAVYKRTRRNEDGVNVQRAEVRFDGVSGCLRTPAGGSSRQTLLIVEGKKIRSRLLSSREAARLMGVPDDYQLPKAYNEAYHLMGDGLVVPAVAWLDEHILSPLAKAAQPLLKGAV